jgi:hypothetical protein
MTHETLQGTALSLFAARVLAAAARVARRDLIRERATMRGRDA